MVLVSRHALTEPFNPLSSDQLKEWMRWKGIKIPRKRGTNKETTGKAELAALTKSVPFIDKVVGCRKLRKGISYLSEVGIGLDGRFHPTFPFSADTGRLGSINPNLQNQPHHQVDQNIVDAVRSSIIPSPGMVLVELDWRAQEAVLTGWFAEDEDYIWLSLRDSHSYFAGHALAKLWHKLDSFPALQDREHLLPALKMVKEKFPHERQVLKQFNLATSYGMGIKHASEILKMSQREVAQLFVLKAEAAPKIAAWQLNTQLRAHKEGFLENPFGYRKAFWNVIEKNAKGKPSLSEEANKVLAFPAQSTGAGMLRSTLVAVDGLEGVWDWWFPLVPIHDAILLEAPENRWQEAARMVKDIMEQKWPELGGLSIPCDVKVGRNWNEMELKEVA